MVGNLLEKLRLAQQPTHEDHREESSNRQQDLGGQEIEAVEERHARDSDTGAIPKTQRGKHAQHHATQRCDDRSPTALDVQLFDEIGHNHFKQGNGGSQSGHRQEDEKDDTEEIPARHLVENHRQSTEYQSHTFCWLHAEGESSRENDDTRQHGNQGIGQGDRKRRGSQVVILFDIGTIGNQHAHAHAKREKHLTQGADQHVPCDFGEIRVEQEFQSGTSSGQGQRTEGQYHKNEEQHGHQHL